MLYPVRYFNISPELGNGSRVHSGSFPTKCLAAVDGKRRLPKTVDVSH